MLAVVFPPFAQRLENSVSRACWPQFDIARSFPQFPRPLLLQPTILTSERGTRFGIRKAPNHVPPPHLPDDPFLVDYLKVFGHLRPSLDRLGDLNHLTTQFLSH